MYNRFKAARADVNDDVRPGSPTTATTDENIELLREIAADIGISFGSCQTIFNDVLGMKREAVKIVSKLLNFGQKQDGIDIAQ